MVALALSFENLWIYHQLWFLTLRTPDPFIKPQVFALSGFFKHRQRVLLLYFVFYRLLSGTLVLVNMNFTQNELRRIFAKVYNNRAWRFKKINCFSARKSEKSNSDSLLLIWHWFNSQKITVFIALDAGVSTTTFVYDICF